MLITELVGIALVERSRQLPNPPLVLVISGYDDFSYSVSMLRSGVQDYLLKPVETEKFHAAMDRLSYLLAQRMLRETDLRVSEISARAGFSGEKHFSKVFKAAMGVSPSDWRRLDHMKER